MNSLYFLSIFMTLIIITTFLLFILIYIKNKIKKQKENEEIKAKEEKIRLKKIEEQRLLDEQYAIEIEKGRIRKIDMEKTLQEEAAQEKAQKAAQEKLILELQKKQIILIETKRNFRFFFANRENLHNYFSNISDNKLMFHYQQVLIMKEWCFSYEKIAECVSLYPIEIKEWLFYDCLSDFEDAEFWSFDRYNMPLYVNCDHKTISNLMYFIEIIETMTIEEKIYFSLLDKIEKEKYLHNIDDKIKHEEIIEQQINELNSKKQMINSAISRETSNFQAKKEKIDKDSINFFSFEKKNTEYVLNLKKSITIALNENNKKIHDMLQLKIDEAINSIEVKKKELEYQKIEINKAYKENIDKLKIELSVINLDIDRLNKLRSCLKKVKLPCVCMGSKRSVIR